jgi:hypothetical protein
VYESVAVTLVIVGAVGGAISTPICSAPLDDSFIVWLPGQEFDPDALCPAFTSTFPRATVSFGRLMFRVKVVEDPDVNGPPSNKSESPFPDIFAVHPLPDPDIHTYFEDGLLTLIQDMFCVPVLRTVIGNETVWFPANQCVENPAVPAMAAAKTTSAFRMFNSIIITERIESFLFIFE